MRNFTIFLLFMTWSFPSSSKSISLDIANNSYSLCKSKDWIDIEPYLMAPLRANINSGIANCNWLKAIKKLKNQKKVPINVLEYAGGFRISASKFGDFERATTDYSYGVFAYDPKRNSIFVVGHPAKSAIAEFPLPEIRLTDDINDFDIAKKPRQPFVAFDGTKRVDTGIKHYFRATGLAKIDNAIVMNYINWYDASGLEKDTSIMIWDASQLAKSAAYGPYQIQGAAHASGWISPIPEYLHDLLGGTYITGNQPYASISSRLSVGPSAFSYDPRKDIVYGPAGEVSTNALMDFPLKYYLKDDQLYSSTQDKDGVLYNKDGKNKLWTILSGASYGFIVPNSRTYLTLGFSGGHMSGAGYKIKQDTGRLCGGPCSKVAKDNHSYYWLWDVMDFVKVRLGIMKPHEIRPYSYGRFMLPESFTNKSISSGSYDPINNRLFLSIKGGDKQNKYARPPLFLVFKLP